MRTYGGEMTGNIGIDSWSIVIIPWFGMDYRHMEEAGLYSTRFSSCFIALFTGIQYLVSVIFRKKAQRVCLNNCLPAAYIDDLI